MPNLAAYIGTSVGICFLSGGLERVCRQPGQVVRMPERSIMMKDEVT